MLTGTCLHGCDDDVTDGDEYCMRRTGMMSLRPNGRRVGSGESVG